MTKTDTLMLGFGGTSAVTGIGALLPSTMQLPLAGVAVLSLAAVFLILARRAVHARRAREEPRSSVTFEPSIRLRPLPAERAETFLGKVNLLGRDALLIFVAQKANDRMTEEVFEVEADADDTRFQFDFTPTSDMIGEFVTLIVYKVSPSRRDAFRTQEAASDGKKRLPNPPEGFERLGSVKFLVIGDGER